MTPPVGVFANTMDDDCSQSIEVTVQDPQWAGVVTDVEAFSLKVAGAALLELPLEDLPAEVRNRVELGIQLVNDEHIRELNARWRDKDRATNVLSFPGQDPDVGWPDFGPVLLGDIVIARETVVREAALAGLSVDAHLAHMIVHGILHLCGHDHLDEKDAERMEGLERSLLAALGYSDPYAGSEPAMAGGEP